MVQPPILPLLAIASVKYKSPHKGDLTFAKGETVRVLGLAPKADDDDDDDEQDEWFVGESLDHSRHGTFPGGFISFLPSEQQEPVTEPEMEPVPKLEPEPAPEPAPETVASPAAPVVPATKPTTQEAPEQPVPSVTAGPKQADIHQPTAASADSHLVREKVGVAELDPNPNPWGDAASGAPAATLASEPAPKPTGTEPIHAVELTPTTQIPESENAMETKANKSIDSPIFAQIDPELAAAAPAPESETLPNEPVVASELTDASKVTPAAEAVPAAVPAPGADLAPAPTATSATHTEPATSAAAAAPTPAAAGPSAAPTGAKPPPAVPKKSNALRDRIAAFNKPTDAPTPPPIHRTGAGWKRPPPAAGDAPIRPPNATAPTSASRAPAPAPAVPSASASSSSAAHDPPASSASANPNAAPAEPNETNQGGDAGGFSAADAKSSIKMSLKERMAALQRGGAGDDSGAAPAARAPPPAAPKPGRLGADRRAAALAGIGSNTSDTAPVPPVPATTEPTETKLEESKSKPETELSEAAKDHQNIEPATAVEGQEPVLAEQPTERAETTEATEPSTAEPAKPTEEQKEASEAAERKAAILRRLQHTGGMKIGAPPPMFGAPAPTKPPPAATTAAADQGTTEEEPLFGSDEDEPKDEPKVQEPEQPEQDEAERKAAILRRLQAGGGMSMFGSPASRPPPTAAEEAPAFAAVAAAVPAPKAEETTKEEGLFGDEEDEPTALAAPPRVPVAKPAASASVSASRPPPPRRVAPPRHQASTTAETATPATSTAPPAPGVTPPFPAVASIPEPAEEATARVGRDEDDNSLFKDADPAPTVPSGKPATTAVPSEPIPSSMVEDKSIETKLLGPKKPVEAVEHKHLLSAVKHEDSAPVPAVTHSLAHPPEFERRESTASSVNTAPLGEDEMAHNQALLDQLLAGPPVPSQAAPHAPTQKGAPILLTQRSEGPEE